MGISKWAVTFDERNYVECFGDNVQNLVYLTADAKETLGTVGDDMVVVIGGLVDRNRHKGLCHNLAKEKGVRTAAFPISKHMQLKTSMVRVASSQTNLDDLLLL